MAVDTKQKRMSVVNFGDGNTFHLLSEPDAAVDGDDKQLLLDCYSGIAFGAPAGGRIMFSLAASGGLAYRGGIAGKGGGLAG